MTHRVDTYSVAGPDLTASELWDLFTRPEWHQHAACRGLGNQTFFGKHTLTQPAIVKSKAVCATCPVIDQCRTTHVENSREEFGVWAGLTPEEARRWRREHGTVKPRVLRPHGTLHRSWACDSGPDGTRCALCAPVYAADMRDRSSRKRSHKKTKEIAAHGDTGAEGDS